MNSIISVGALLTWAFSLHAQVNARLDPLPDGSTQIRITNDAVVDLTAFAIRVKETNGVFEGGRLIAYADSAIDAVAAPVLPHQQRLVEDGRRFVMPRNGRGTWAVFEQPIITAGIFADGSTSGDATLLHQLLLRRRTMLQAVEMALDILSDAGRRNVPRDQLIGRFRKMEESVSRWYLAEEQRVGRSLYQSLVAKLIALPEVQVGSPFPPTTFVEQEAAMLNRQRYTLLDSQPSLADAALIGR